MQRGDLRLDVAQWMSFFSTHRVVFGGLEKYPEQPGDPGAEAHRHDGLIQVLLSLQGQQELSGQEKSTATSSAIRP